MIGHTLRGAALVAAQEFRTRLRTRRWRWLLGAWIVVLALFTLLVDLAFRKSSLESPSGVPLFGTLMLFVLGLVMVISPALTARSINGDRKRGILATLQLTRLTPVQIMLGKLASGWAVGLVMLALTLPFVAWSMVEGGLTVLRVAGVLGVEALLMGVICAVSQALSALLARGIMSVLLSYLLVFAMTIGTGIAFGLASTLVQQRHVMGSDETGTTYIEMVPRTDYIWWLMAPNPFVILIDSAPRLPPDGGPVALEPDDPLGFSEVGYMRLSPAEQDRAYQDDSPGKPVWPYGLAFDLALAVAGGYVTVRRLRAPSRRVPRGVRIG